MGRTITATGGMRFRRLFLAVLLAVLVAGLLGGPSMRAYAATSGDSNDPYVVVIDAGHQRKANLKKEPIGPGSKKRKPKVAGGTTGVYTRNRESAINLKVALRLRTELEDRGVKVVMIRTKQKVNISNSKRAKKANAAHADLVIHLHCDGLEDSKVKGVMTLVPKKNKWTKHFYKASLRAGKDIQKATRKATKAKNRGVERRWDLTGFNWSKVPTVMVEMGVMTNRSEDRRLDTARYQKKLAKGIADGTMRYLERDTSK